MRDYKDLQAFAKSCGFTVTSTIGGKHNVNSKHAQGLAIDVRTRNKENAEIARFVRQCHALGITVRDERTKPQGQKIWHGAHLHLEITAQTALIVRAFQASVNLQVDGIAGKNTFAAVRSAIV